MRVYTLHAAVAKTADGPDIVPVKEGFCWPAFVLTPIWALWHRLWWAAAGIFAVNLGINAVFALTGADDVTRSAAALAFAAIVGWLAGDLRRRVLTRRGFAEIEVIAAASAEDAVARYLDGAAVSLPRPGATPETP